ncbi:MAG: hypothetical protein SVR81_09340 [Chloroflexota bacterium]|nr:hypothetical protein [Chloroflexota bacterium]
MRPIQDDEPRYISFWHRQDSVREQQTNHIGHGEMRNVEALAEHRHQYGAVAVKAGLFTQFFK